VPSLRGAEVTKYEPDAGCGILGKEITVSAIGLKTNKKELRTKKDLK